MATTTQYNPQADLNRRLLEARVSKTVYALVTPETEAAKAIVLGDAAIDAASQARRAAHLEQFRDAWTGKQEQYHRDFFDTWRAWAAPLVDLDLRQFPFSYPTAGASEPLRHIIYDYGNIARAGGFAPRIHVFKDEYEGYKDYANAANIEVVEHDRHDWQHVAATLPENEWFFLSQPSAIDGKVWPEGNEFLHRLSINSNKPRIVMDLSLAGTIIKAPPEKIAASEPSVRNIVFSLSESFGAHNDRIGGVFSRKEDSGLFGNMWFKSLMALQIGTALMQRYDVFALPRQYGGTSNAAGIHVTAAAPYPETQATKDFVLGNTGGSIRNSYPSAQLHGEFFDTWHMWSAPLVDLDRKLFPFSYPTAGASEPLRHLIYDYGNTARIEGFMPRVHIFRGEYEGYKAYAEAAGIEVVEHDRRDWQKIAETLPVNERFFLSQPSAIDGNVWPEANQFLRILSAQSDKPRVIMDMTYVGAIANAPAEKFAISEPSVRNVVFSLSKPFGVYYDRIGGVFCREEDPGLVSNLRFDNPTAVQLGTLLMQRHGVFELPRKYRPVQIEQMRRAGTELGIRFEPSDIDLLATAADALDSDMVQYLRRPQSDPSARLRICLTPGMAEAIGTAGPVRNILQPPGTSHERAPT